MAQLPEEDETPPSLVDRLRHCAQLWVLANDASETGLCRAAVKDPSFLANIGPRGPGTTKLEQFAQFFANPANWPAGAVPEEARAFAHVVGVSAPDALVSAGKGAGVSPTFVKDAEDCPDPQDCLDPQAPGAIHPDRLARPDRPAGGRPCGAARRGDAGEPA